MLLSEMRAIAGGHATCFLFNELFLRKIPENKRSQLADEDFYDLKALGKKADAIWKNFTKDGYLILCNHQIPIREEDIPKTAVTTYFGLFEFHRMPFGLRNAAQTFQRLMDIMASDLDSLFCKLREYSLIVNVEKCVFGIETLDFLGHRISPHGVSLLPSKVENIQKFRLPTSIESLQTFTGMVNFYHRFIPNAAQIMQPLYNLIDRGSRSLEWKRPALKVLNEIKQRMANIALIVYRQRDALLSLTTYASAIALGGVVQHFHEGICLSFAIASVDEIIDKNCFRPLHLAKSKKGCFFMGKSLHKLPESEDLHSLTIVDRFTRCSKAIPVRDTTADNYANQLILYWISSFSVPSVISSDRGSQYTSKLWLCMSENLGNRHNFTTDTHPQSNVLVERLHRTLKASRRARLANDTWTDHLPWNENLNVCFAELVFGSQVSLPCNFSTTTPDDVYSDQVRSQIFGGRASSDCKKISLDRLKSIKRIYRATRKTQTFLKTDTTNINDVSHCRGDMWRPYA
ncbi:hypothetical protein RF11_15635 [Thelohanellus kitauei]|uniref:Integrase catalytic domain-containing protein n=1 Tax=Thelohanellus kitauei TaxID=669202 RepID=A0A0C2NEW2_THEKT|nr:hypothetical protein RF11_15635 [Thelohanellus kitauei]